MGSTQAAKAASHERIVEVAARQLRERGFGDVSVPLVMQAAGLTHGGFYKHFESKDDLLDEATARALAEGAQRLTADDADRDPLETFLARYLSVPHRDHPGTGCAVTCLAGSVAGAAPRTRARYTERVRRYVSRVQDLLARRDGAGGDELDPDQGAPARRDEALTTISTLVGAVLLSRAVDDPELSDDLLRAARDQLTTPRARPETHPTDEENRP